MYYKGFAIAPVTGYSHHLLGKPCQDSSNVCITNDYAIAVVSDGHGGEQYFRSEKGSQYAVDVAISVLKKFFENDKANFFSIIETKNKNDIDKTIKNIKCKIIKEWREKVYNDSKRNKLNEKEKKLLDKWRNKKQEDYIPVIYGATLIIACITNKFSIVFQIGDGESICLQTDKIWSPIEKDERLQFGLTTSLCDNNAIDNFHHYYFSYDKIKNIKGFILSTDGIANSYNNIDLNNFSQKIMEEFFKNEEYTKAQLKEWLEKLTREGSHDDMTIAGIFIG